jgi:hypothetical protein
MVHKVNYITWEGVPTMTGLEAAVTAAAALERAVQLAEDAATGNGLMRVGIFGNGLPETLIAAAGGLPVHVSLGTTTAEHPIQSVIEPFVDEEVRHFLVRLMLGEFSGLQAIVFSRDDAPALIAYQYATEWIRQDRLCGKTPPLFLWNLVHTQSAPVQKFNRIQAEKLFAFLASSGLSTPSAASISAAAEDEVLRAQALDAMAAQLGTTLSGATAARWRNAGRFLPARQHVELLNAALGGAAEPVSRRHRIGLVGSPLASAATYVAIEQFGTIVCDEQSFGNMWPGPGNVAPTLEAILEATAADASSFRIAPTRAYRDRLVRRILAAQCSLVICQLSQTDDTFGWDIPALFAQLRSEGVICVNLGFRDAQPDSAWLEEAQRRIANDLEAQP